MNNKIIYENEIENIFSFSFMEDFTTVLLAKEEYKINTSNLIYQDEDDFYSFSEKKAYTKNELFKKFNIQKVI